MLRAARESQGLTQYQLAELTEGGAGGVSRAAISGIERGTNLPGLEALVSLSRVLHLEPAEILERVDLAMTVPVDVSGLSIEDLRTQAERFVWAGDYRRALSIYDAMFQVLVLNPPQDEQERRRLTVRLEVNRAVMLRECSALGASEAAAKRAVLLSDGFRELQAEAYMVLASLHSHDGNCVLAEVMAEQAVKLSEGCENAVRGLAWCQKGAVLHRGKRFDQALEAYARAREFSTNARDSRNLIVVEGSIGSCLVDLGKKAAARKQLVKSIELARKHHDPAAESSRLVELGRLSLAAGDLDEADTLAHAALRISKPAELCLTIFRAEWLRHLIASHKSPNATDRHRVVYLKKLYPRVRGHRTADAVSEFEREILESNPPQEGAHD